MGEAALWVAVLILLATPLVNPWAMSAKSQYTLLANGRIAAEDFDFGYMRFSLGKYGDVALDKLLALENHPEAAAIRDGVMRARDADSYWLYKYPAAIPDEQPAGNGSEIPETLPFNPEGADTGPDDPDSDGENG